MDNDERDRLDELLGGRDPASVEDLRQRGLAQTLPVLRRRRLVRRTGWALAFTGCYLAGLATHDLWQRGEADHPAVGQHPAAPQKPKRGSSAGTRLVGQPQSSRPQSQFEQLRGAGDEALQRRGDIEAAVRLYAQAIEVATPEEMKISASDDNWLLMALKQDHVQENEHVDVEEPSDADRS